MSEIGGEPGYPRIEVRDEVPRCNEFRIFHGTREMIGQCNGIVCSEIPRVADRLLAMNFEIRQDHRNTE